MLKALRKVEGASGTHPRSQNTESLRLELRDEWRLNQAALDDYPFLDQLVLEGRYEYSKDPTWGSPEHVDGSFQLRTASGLLLIEISADRPSPTELAKEFDKAIDSGLRVSRDFVPSRGKVWSFVDQADSVLSLRARDETGQVRNLAEVHDAQNPREWTVEHASLKFGYGGGFFLDFERDSISIYGVDEGDEEPAIETLEVAFLTGIWD